ncbi:hypothetical protein [Adlercreutzia caecimuris]|uniref:hypothetical protein n=1 Tax=Adlercreutzia caecimuris TaxID=671266 RepID=UPI00272B73AB|nr:hypothetical protein [Adlercreutzia caecimuris]
MGKKKNRKNYDDLSIDVLETYRLNVVHNLARMVTGNKRGEMGRDEWEVIAEAEEKAAEDIHDIIEGMICEAQYRLNLTEDRAGEEVAEHLRKIEEAEGIMGEMVRGLHETWGE